MVERVPGTGGADAVRAFALSLGVLLGFVGTLAAALVVRLVRPSRLDRALCARAAAAAAIAQTQPRRVRPSTVLPDGFLACGAVRLDPARPLGTVAPGAELFGGKLEDGRAVTVKRVCKRVRGAAAAHDAAFLVQTECLCRAAVTVYALEEDLVAYFFAITPCRETLAAWIQRRAKVVADAGEVEEEKENGDDKGGNEENKRRVPVVVTAELSHLMLGIAKGIQWLHQHGLVHGDLSPEKIVIDQCGNPRICDFGFVSQQQQQEAPSDSQLPPLQPPKSNNNAPRTPGWVTPEVLRNGEDAVSCAADAFALGCLFQCMATGQHPFGYTAAERDAHVAAFAPDFAPLSTAPLLLHLVQMLVRRDPAQRALVDDAVGHIFFWPLKKRIDFVCTVFERLDSEPPTALVRRQMEEYLGRLPELRAWQHRVDPCLFGDSTNRRVVAYETRSDVLRLIRNKARHFHDLDPREKALLVSFPEGFFRYFDDRFPALFVCVFEFICHTLSHEPCFNGIYF